MNLLKNLSDAAKLKLKLGLLLLGVLVCGAIVFRGCGSNDDLVESTGSQVIRDSFDSKLRFYEAEIKNNQDSTAYYKHLADSLSKKSSVTEKRLSVEKKKVVSLAAEVILSKKITDTSKHSEKCDSLALQIPEFIATIDSYKDEIDSLNLVRLKEREHSEATITNLQKFNSDLRISFKDMSDKNSENERKIENLNKQYSKKLRKEKTLSRIVAAGAAVAIGALIIK